MLMGLRFLECPTAHRRVPTERFGPGVKDVQWIGELSAEGRWMVGDRQRVTVSTVAELELALEVGAPQNVTCSGRTQ